MEVRSRPSKRLAIFSLSVLQRPPTLPRPGSRQLDRCLANHGVTAAQEGREGIEIDLNWRAVRRPLGSGLAAVRHEGGVDGWFRRYRIVIIFFLFLLELRVGTRWSLFIFFCKLRLVTPGNALPRQLARKEYALVWRRFRRRSSIALR